MAKNYHISDDGTPGVCRAKTSETCPKTKAGDPFHGSREEASAEAESRFSKTFGLLPGKSTLLNAEAEAKLPLIRSSVAALVAANRKIDWNGTDTQIQASLAANYEAMKKDLVKLYGLRPDAITYDNRYVTIETSQGQRAIYGSDKQDALAYLGVLHPSLKEPIHYGSETMFMVGDRAATPQEVRNGEGTAYAYAIAALTDGTEVHYTTDIEGNPADRQVWAHTKTEDYTLLQSIPGLLSTLANRGIQKSS